MYNLKVVYLVQWCCWQWCCAGFDSCWRWCSS